MEKLRVLKKKNIKDQKESIQKKKKTSSNRINGYWIYSAIDQIAQYSIDWLRFPTILKWNRNKWMRAKKYLIFFVIYTTHKISCIYFKKGRSKNEGKGRLWRYSKYSSCSSSSCIWEQKGWSLWDLSGTFAGQLLRTTLKRSPVEWQYDNI